MSEAEAARFISETLRDLSRRENVRAPKWEWKDILGLVAYRKEDRVIELREYLVVNAWGTDKERTKRYLSHILAHEFWHHLVELGKIPRASPFASEYEADEYASSFSGLTKTENRVLKRRPLTPDFVAEWVK